MSDYIIPKHDVITVGVAPTAAPERERVDPAVRAEREARFAGCAPAVIDVKVEPWTDGCGNTGISVHPVFAVEGIAIDRPSPGGWVVTNQRMADRLTAALRAGAACPNARIAVDVYGDTYATYDHVVMGKYMNADLKRLGY